LVSSIAEERKKLPSLLDNISIATPCRADWKNMTGTEQIRFCNQCTKHVYNISAMSEAEVGELILKSESVPCIKLFRRKDGTIIFDNCPAALRKARNSVKAAAKFVSALLATLLSCAAVFARDAIKPATPGQGVRIDWTLSENGHTESDYIPPPPVVPTGQLAQLGSPSANFFELFRRSIPEVQKLSVNGAFGKALRLTEKGQLTLAEIEYQKALSEAEKTERDPNLTEFIATEYAGLLRKKGDVKGAERLVDKYKVKDSVNVIKVSTPDQQAESMSNLRAVKCE
jgi:hypothetical protein